jgi:hypothetical protein
VRVADGAVWFDEELVVPGTWSDAARVGMSFLTRPGFERVDWFGRGPDENETDRQAGSLVEPAPASRDGRTPRRRQARRGHRELRPGHARALPRRAGRVALVVVTHPVRSRRAGSGQR